ncbi:MAG: hypothetical protein Q8M35_08475, partial [Pseudohongiella sp.]|nr:hypothetical protein [Pseudohongiella sp.]
MSKADLGSVHAPASRLRMSGRWLELSVPRVMGILNDTPDTISDVGLQSAGSATQIKDSLDKAL